MAHAGNAPLLQHYFDTRGVARVYEMSFADGVWKLSRDAADFSPLSFSQRFEGPFSQDGRSIEGAWEICHDGSTWEHDDLHQGVAPRAPFASCGAYRPRKPQIAS